MVVEQYIRKNNLLERGRPLLAALSGGADSVALLLILHDLNYDIIALHCNFHLRGEESDRDEEFVKKLCKQKGIKLFIRHFDTREYAKDKNISIEMAARDLRYEWFEKMRLNLNAQAIAVAHHKDDQAETLLLNLLRGSGLKGLAGIHPRRGYIVRPLLCVDKDFILQYLSRRKQEFVTDSTNLEREALRNIIRLDIMPQLATINPKITDTLSETCRIVQDSMPLYTKGAESERMRLGIDNGSFPLNALHDSKSSPALLHEWLDGKHFTTSQEKDILSCANAVPGKMWESDTHRVLRDRNALLVQDKSDNEPQIHIRQEYVGRIDEKSRNIAYFDADLITVPITIRRSQAGDSFHPLGMKGRKLVSDFLTDRKATRFHKERQMVALCGNDIIWVIGERSDNRYKVTEKTVRILKLTAETK